MIFVRAVAARNIKNVAVSKMVSNKFRTFNVVISFLLILMSAIFLVLSFPRTNYWFLSWISFVPVFFLLDNKTYRQSFLISFLFGTVFFISTLYWFVHVTFIGMLLLSLYLSVFFGFFGIFYKLFSKETIFKKMILLPCCWVLLEYVRSNFLSGFGWVLLGHSQYKNLIVIQIADILGVYGVSFLILMVNVFIKELISSIVSGFRNKIEIFLNAIKLLLILCLVFIYGTMKIEQYSQPQNNFAKSRIAVIQPNIDQLLKWDETQWPLIFEKFKYLSRKAASLKPDLIVWPETSFPGIVGEDEFYFENLLSFIKETKVPFLIGSVYKQADDKYFNSAFFISGEGKVEDRYDKLHLVPFGEFIPLRKFFPVLADIVPIADFTAGKDYKIFHLDKNKNVNFSVLICFEDTLSYLARKFSNLNTGFFINLTNDAWFGDTIAPYLHLQSSIFRTIENRKALLRAANTGVSCSVNEAGEILNCVKHNDKRTYVDGFIISEVSSSVGRTLYNQFFYFVFIFVCLVLVVYRTIRIIIKSKV